MEKTEDAVHAPLAKKTMDVPESDKEKRNPPEDDPERPEAKRAKTDAPDYGSQEYWDQRYRRQFSDLNQTKNEEEDADTLPYHAWYFTYDDLRPLILPLILGGRNDVQGLFKKVEEEDEVENEEEEVDGTKDDVLKHEKNHIAQSEQREDSNQQSDGEDDEEPDDDDASDEVENDNDGFVEVGEDEELDEEADEIEREGLSKNGPISIIEIGCGDVPLGSGLALELKELEETTGASALQIVRRIICTDYSPTVVDTMKSKYGHFEDTESRTKDSADIDSIPLQFAIADARKLNYANRSFELILEKGTLDAMLSDKQEGVANCVQIMRECARILAINGYIVLVSHLNAHTDRGIGWLSDVVFEGLRKGDSNASWSIEVHGNAENSDDLEGVPRDSPGPAVYICRKRTKDIAVAKDDDTIAIEFFSYS